jgi:hypothetical protein
MGSQYWISKHHRGVPTTLVAFGSFQLLLKFFTALLHIVPFCEGPNKKSEGFAKEKQKT